MVLHGTGDAICKDGELQLNVSFGDVNMGTIRKSSKGMPKDHCESQKSQLMGL